ncbi:MAG: energy transducer TonB [Victivallales bacterium]|nr:energy transducer TonB [Victivallales bacterium]
MSLSGTPSSSGLSKMALFAIVMAALFLTFITLFLLPALDAISDKPVDQVVYRPVNTIELPQQLTASPVEQIVKKAAEVAPPKQELSKPRLVMERPRAHTPHLPVRADVAFEPPSLDLALVFQVAPDDNPLPNVVEMQGQVNDAIVVTSADAAENANNIGNNEGVADGNGLIFDGTEVDVAPQPISCPRPQFPYRAKMRGVSGEVRVAFTVLENGSVIDITIIAAEPPGFFEEAALDAVRKWRFKAGRKRDTSVRTRMTTSITFSLVD